MFFRACRFRGGVYSALALLSTVGAFSACASKPDPVPTTPETFRISGSVSGLQGSGLVLQNNASSDVTVSATSATFAFDGIPKSANYAISIKTQPTSPWQTCTIANGSGVVTANVSGVSVICTTNNYAVRGTVAGLTGTGLTLLINGGSSQAIASGATAFAFASVQSGAAYAVTVGTQPAGQNCTVSGGSGTVGGADVTGVSVTCAPTTVRVGGKVNGLVGSGLVLQNNASTDLAVTAAADSFFFANVTPNSSYAVTVKTQPTLPWQTCAVANGSGVASANVLNVALTCVTNSYVVRGTIAGLSATGLTLQLNGGTPLSIASGATSFSFPTVLSGTAYTITVGTQPTGLTCAVSNSVGTVNGGDVTTVGVTCAAATITIGGPSLVGSPGLTLRLNGGTPLAVDSGATSYRFPTAIPVGTPWSMTVSSQPQTPQQTCLIARGRGIATSANVTNTQVQCYANSGLRGLSGTYAFDLGARRSFVTIWADGTLSMALFNDDAACPNNGNGAEYGSYRRTANGTFTPWAFKFDETGGCGLFDPSIALGTGPVGSLTRVGNTLTLVWQGATLVEQAVAQDPTSLVGAWVRADGNDGSFIVFEADGTYTYVEAQDAGTNGGSPGGFERGCYVVNGSTFTATASGSCRPNGLLPFDSNGSGGFSGKNGAAISFSITSSTTATINGLTYVRSTPGG